MTPSENTPFWQDAAHPFMVSLAIVAGALLVIIAGRVFIGRALHAVAETPGLIRLMSLRTASHRERRREGARRERRTKTVASLLNNALTVIVCVVSFLMILDVWGLPVGPLLTSVGIVGVAIGFGFQQIFRDYLAGIFITVEDQFGIGDLIETSEVKGRVRAMSLRITTVEAEDGAIWYLRNGEILRVANHSQGMATTALPVTAQATDGEHGSAQTPQSGPGTAPTTIVRRLGPEVSPSSSVNQKPSASPQEKSPE